MEDEKILPAKRTAWVFFNFFSSSGFDELKPSSRKFADVFSPKIWNAGKCLVAMNPGKKLVFSSFFFESFRKQTWVGLQVSDCRSPPFLFSPSQFDILSSITEKALPNNAGKNSMSDHLFLWSPPPGAGVSSLSPIYIHVVFWFLSQRCGGVPAPAPPR